MERLPPPVSPQHFGEVDSMLPIDRLLPMLRCEKPVRRRDRLVDPTLHVDRAFGALNPADSPFDLAARGSYAGNTPGRESSIARKRANSLGKWISAGSQSIHSPLRKPS
jgi:hypothetical protein